jgi:hypothetical protein
MRIDKLRGWGIFSRLFIDRRVNQRYLKPVGHEAASGKVTSFRVRPNLTIDKAVENLVGTKRSEQVLRGSFEKILKSAGFENGRIDLSQLEDAEVDFLERNIVNKRDIGEQRQLSVLAARIGHPDDVFYPATFKKKDLHNGLRPLRKFPDRISEEDMRKLREKMAELKPKPDWEKPI